MCHVLRPVRHYVNSANVQTSLGTGRLMHGPVRAPRGHRSAPLEDLLEARQRGPRLLLWNTSDDELRGRRSERAERRAELVAIVKVRQAVTAGEAVLGDGARACGAAALPARG